MITAALILTFCSIDICEEYVVDSNLSKQDCIERKREELIDMSGQSFDVLYKDAVERYQAVAMRGEIERVSLKCVRDDY